MAAETLSRAGLHVDVYDAMPSVGRKFLLAGRGGLNLTHSEPFDAFCARYGDRSAEVTRWLEGFDAAALQAWVRLLGVSTFVGSSGRVFPEEMKAAPLLRKWLQRLKADGVVMHARHRWTGWAPDGALQFHTPTGAVSARPDAVVLALGGASWARLGSDGAWQPVLEERAIAVAPLLPANGGFVAPWTPHFVARFAGHPLKSVAASVQGSGQWRRGECMVTHDGLEGGLVYAWSAALRHSLMEQGSAVLEIDLLPGRSAESVREEVARPRGSRSWSSHLASRLGLHDVKVGLLRECLTKDEFADPDTLAAAIKRLPVRLHGMRPLDEAISTAGGVRFDNLDARGMLRAVPGVFCAGEMLDWEAPTGGYLLTACFASGRAAGRGVVDWLAGRGAPFAS
jgi:uncharacterized flavoprotein (TIGR03862 family)